MSEMHIRWIRAGLAATPAHKWLFLWHHVQELLSDRRSGNEDRRSRFL
jgi:hypothetical protein